MRRCLTVTTMSAEETRIVGASLAPALLPGDVLSLSGDLGAGKTVFVQGLAAGLGVERHVTSPTFTIIHEYEGRFPIVHMDVYRLDSLQEVLDLGFEELLDGGAILVVEWGEALIPLLPPRHVEIDIFQDDAAGPTGHRRMFFQGDGEEWSRKLETMRSTAEVLLDAAGPEASLGPRFGYASRPAPRDHRGAWSANEEA